MALFPGVDGGPIKKVTLVDTSGTAVTLDSGSTRVVSTSQTLSGSNTTVATPIFSITGMVEVTRLWVVVTTTLGSNHTAAYYRLNDQTAQVDITLNTGSTLSSFAAGSGGFKKGLTTVALQVINNSAGRVNDSGTSGVAEDFFACVLTKKTAAATNIEYVYTTTNTPTSGVLKHYVEYRALSDDGAVAAL